MNNTFLYSLCWLYSSHRMHPRPISEWLGIILFGSLSSSKANCGLGTRFPRHLVRLSIPRAFRSSITTNDNSTAQICKANQIPEFVNWSLFIIDDWRIPYNLRKAYKRPLRLDDLPHNNGSHQQGVSSALVAGMRTPNVPLIKLTGPFQKVIWNQSVNVFFRITCRKLRSHRMKRTGIWMAFVHKRVSRRWSPFREMSMAFDKQ